VTKPIDNLLPPAIRDYLAALAARRQRLSLLRAVGSAISLALAHAIAFCVIDRVIRLPGEVRLVSLMANVTIAILIVARPLWHWARGPAASDWIATSELAERQDSGWKGQLSTVTSRLLGPQRYIGSDAILNEVTDGASARAAGVNPQLLLPTRLALVPWAVAGLLALATVAALPNDWLNLPRLAARYVMPLSQLGPVTSTRLTVLPGSVRLPQGEGLTIRVTAQRLGEQPPRLHASNDGAAWSQHLLVPSDGAYIHRIDPLARDLRYFVTGGDAVSPIHDISVLRKPLVSDFRVSYTYPRYTNRSQLILTNKTGLIEAPAGTQATLTIIATEPITAATLHVDGAAVETTATLDPHVRQARLVVDRDAAYSVTLVSDRGVTNVIEKHSIRSLPDRPPLVRLLDAEQGQRPGPRDLFSIAYQALDDYGLEDVAVLLRVNGGHPIEIGLKVRGDARRQEQEYAVDLAPLNVNVGDVVAVSVAARDGRRQRTESSALSALISPRAIDMNAHGRVIELEAARTVAEQLVKAWEGALRSVDRLGDRPSRGAASSTMIAEINRGVIGAGEAAAVLRQSLLRATLRSRSHEMSVALAAALDLAQLQLLASERLAGASGPSRDEARRALTKARDDARTLRDSMRTIAVGEQAAAVQAERENVAAAIERSKAADYPAVLKKGVERLTNDLAQSLKAIGIDPAAGDVPQQLQRRVEAGEAAMASLQPVDFAKASDDWAVEIAGEHQPTGFEERLMIAAQAEAVRPDADLTRARDVHVSAEAAARIERREVAPTTRPTDPLPRELYPASMLALQRFHETNRPMQDRPSSDDVAARATVAAEGRRRMFAWAGLQNVDVRSQPIDDSPPADASPETLAMQANAAAASRDYAAAARLDQQLAAAPANHAPGAVTEGAAPPPAWRIGRAARAMAAAEQIDKLAAEQQSLAEETKRSAPRDAGSLAARQETLAGAITDARDAARPELRGSADPTWREEATAAIQAAQEQLAAMPQALAQLARAESLRRDAVAHAARAAQQADEAPPDQQPAARRAAEQADRDRLEAATASAAAGQPVLPKVAEMLSARLAPFRPATAISVREIDVHLTPALRALEQSVGRADAVELERASDATRLAVERVQAALQAAQQELIERDPLVAARWFARAATRSLTERPPDLLSAERQQRVASAALARAWDRSIRQSAGERLAGVPSMAPVFNLFPIDIDGGGTVPGQSTLTSRLGSLAPGIRQWGSLRPREASDTTSGRHDVDVSGYEEPVRLYFEALGKIGEQKK
jgi:hypothetical protein